MAMTLRLDETEHEALRRLAESEGVSMQDIARRAVRELVARSEHRSRVMNAAQRVADAHAEALDELGR